MKLDLQNLVRLQPGSLHNIRRKTALRQDALSPLINIDR